MAEFKSLQFVRKGKSASALVFNAKDGSKTELDMSFSDLVALSNFLARKINQIATANHSPRDQNVKMLTDAVAANKADVSNDLLAETIYLAIEDKYGRSAWKIPPDAAETLGKQLQDQASKLKATMHAKN